MQTFYVIVKKSHLSIFEKKGDLYERVYLAGNPEYTYSLNNVKESIENFINAIAEEYNLDKISELNFVIIDNEDEVVSKIMINAFGDRVQKQINIEKLLLELLESIKSETELKVSEFGINYDGKKYMLKDEKIQKEDFNLLAYTLTDDLLMKYVG